MSTNVLHPSKEGKFWIENDILFCKLDDVNCFLTEDRVHTYLSEIEEKTAGIPMPLVVDIRKFIGNFSPDAAKLFADSAISKNCVLTQAFIADTLHARLLVGSYLRIYGGNANIRIFKKMESALAYCTEIKNNSNHQRN